MHPSSRPQSICGVIVTYNPDPEILRQLVTAVVPQLERLLVVDNGSRQNVGNELSDMTEVEIVELGDNYGIAHAQNVGIEKAREREAAYVLLLDQDSIPAANMVETLLTALLIKQQQGFRVACVGPRYSDNRHEGATPFVKLNGRTIERQACTSDDAIIDVDFLIASGCLIPMATLNAVGIMKDEMFIDYVDIEWGLRAQHQGYLSYGVCAAGMSHALGDASIALGQRQIPVHSPLRHYYHIRNAIWLCRQSWLSLDWKIALVYRVVRQMLFFSIMTPPRLQHARMMSVGFVHGIVNRMGRHLSG